MGGTVFRVTTAGRLEKIHRFDYGELGRHLVARNDGKVYGALGYGSGGPLGVWSLTPVPGKPWALSFIYSAANFTPISVVGDTSGDLYGTTPNSVFRLRPPTSGDMWTFKLLHRFGAQSSPDGNMPYVLKPKDGVLYGTTLQGGSQSPQCLGVKGCGTVFRYKRD